MVGTILIPFRSKHFPSRRCFRGRVCKINRLGATEADSWEDRGSGRLEGQAPLAAGAFASEVDPERLRFILHDTLTVYWTQKQKMDLDFLSQGPTH